MISFEYRRPIPAVFMPGLPVILCVDDEKIILNSLKSQLVKEFGPKCAVEISDRGDDALEMISELLAEGRDVPVVIADQIMPGLKGNELLRQVRTLSPRTFNILLTGQADVAAIADAVNNGGLYRYIGKPWDGTDLILTVREALRSFYQDKKLEEQNVLLKKYNEELEDLVRERTAELKQEMEKSEKLLLNILPAETARELKEYGHSIPRHYEKATILFADFKGFTRIAANMSADQLVEELGSCFSAFDSIVQKNGLEKIKTIGDAYMCAGGVPLPVNDHPLHTVNAAFEMMDWIEEWNRNRTGKNCVMWEMRIGIHTGPLVAGVIGHSKFAYDVWGDTVNIASRIESAGEPGRINISQDTFSQISEHYTCTSRGMIDTKNRGAIGMYFVEKLK